MDRVGVLTNTSDKDKAHYFNLLASGFIKSVEQREEEWYMTFWDDDANEYEFHRFTLYDLMFAFSEYMAHRITYAELIAERVGWIMDDRWKALILVVLLLIVIAILAYLRVV